MQPPSSPTAQGEPLYEAFYGLREQPFALSTDPRFLFLSGSHRRAHDELLTGLRRREGLLLLTGETGTGKTTLCRAVIDALGHRTFSALILNPYMSDAEVLRVILRDFGLVSREEIRRGALAKADMPQLLDTLEGFLRSLLPLNSFAVVIIDEAQSLTPQVLDQIRVLGSSEQDGQRLLQIVLVGQPDLAETLKTDRMRALNERISRRVALAPLGPEEVDAYIRHRLEIAGGRERVTFLPDAVALIADRAHGLPRRVNLLCDRALEEGRTANTTTITTAIVLRAARAIAGAAASVDNFEPRHKPEPIVLDETEISLTLGQREETPRRSRGGLIMGLAAVLIVAAGAAGFYGWTLGSKPLDLPPWPTPPVFTEGLRPTPIPLPSDDELKRELDAMKAALRAPAPAPTPAPPPVEKVSP